MKKIIWIVVGCVCIGLLSYGVLGAADTPASAEISQEAKGQFARVEDGGKRLVVTTGGQEASYPISSTVWVYRNNQKAALTDLKTGDAVEVILNSKEQAAYIKAFSAAESSPAQPQQEQKPASGVTPTQGAAAGVTAAAANDGKPVGPVLPPAAEASGQPNAAQKPSADSGKTSAGAGAVASSRASGGAPRWEKLSFEWKSREFELKAKQEPGKASATEIYLKTQDRSVIRLDGVAAESFIQLLVKGLPAEPKAFEQALKQKVASDFQLSDRSADWKLDVKWADKVQPASQPQESKGKGNEKSKDDKEKEQGKDKEKQKDDGDRDDD